MKKDPTKQELLDLVELLKWNAELGCYTRQAFENVVWPEVVEKAAWLIFFDVDNMKALNSAGSWDRTSNIIKESIVMRSTDHVAGQVLSGDEFVVIVAESPDRPKTKPRRLCERILQNFRARGASATFAYSRIVSKDYRVNLDRIKEFVNHAKERGDRGSITFVEGGS